MKRNFLFWSLLLTASSAMFSACTNDDDDQTNKEDLIEVPNGDGSEASPFKISNAEELLYFAAIVNGNVDTIPQNKNAYGIVIADIDMSSVCGSTLGSWVPIGLDTCRYTGVFDGGNHTISNIYISGSSVEGQGLFGIVKGANIKNVIIGSGNIISKANCTAAIAGFATGTISNCHNFAHVESNKKFAGGIVGYLGANSKIELCHNEGEIKGTNSDKTQFGVGGIGGAVSTNSVVNDCYNLGKVTGQSSRVGGIVGSAENCSISNCYSYADVASLSKDYGGGICAIASDYPKTSVKDCYFYNALGQTGQQQSMERPESDFNDGTIFELLNQKHANVWEQDGNNYPVFK